MQRFVVLCIRIYQRTFSPDHGSVPTAEFVGCKYYPSCSQYTIDAVEAQGVTKGLLKGAWRILRCNPLSKGGVDEINTQS